MLRDLDWLFVSTFVAFVAQLHTELQGELRWFICDDPAWLVIDDLGVLETAIFIAAYVIN